MNPGYGNQLPSFVEWMEHFQRDEVDDQQEGHHGGDVRALGGDVVGGEGGGDGRVGRLVDFHESSVMPQKKISRMRTPNRRRGVRRDGLVQTRLASFDVQGRGARKLPGLLGGGGGGKRKLETVHLDSPSKLRRKGQ